MIEKYRCHGCKGVIADKVVLQVATTRWHQDCLRCVDCRRHFVERCYVRDDHVFCRNDYFRRYGRTKCAGCGRGIAPSTQIRTVRQFVYHVNCLVCSICARRLETGDQFYVVEQSLNGSAGSTKVDSGTGLASVVCKRDYDIAKTSDADSCSGNKKPRTSISNRQLDTLRRAYADCPRPGRQTREKISAQTGLDMRVVQVWFQNRRAKEKRLQREGNIVSDVTR